MSTVLVAETGRATGSANSRRLRREDHIPGVVYGHGMDPISISVVRRDLRLALSGPAGVNTVIDLTVDGKVYPAIVKDLQRHPVRRNVSHIDFIQVDLNEEITIAIPLRLEGEAKAVIDEGVQGVVRSRKGVVRDRGCAVEPQRGHESPTVGDASSSASPCVASASGPVWASASGRFTGSVSRCVCGSVHGPGSVPSNMIKSSPCRRHGIVLMPCRTPKRVRSVAAHGPGRAGYRWSVGVPRRAPTRW